MPTKNSGENTKGQNKKREDLQLPPISKRIEDRQLRWFGHVTRTEEHQKPRQFVEARPQGKRPIGRQRTAWRDVIEQVAASRVKTLGQLRSLAGDSNSGQTKDYYTERDNVGT